MSDFRRKKTLITMVGGGNETFPELSRAIIPQSRTMGFKFKAGTLTTTPITIDFEINFDPDSTVEDWDELTDSSGVQVSETLASDGTLTIPLADVPYGATIRPKFVTDSTGDITVTSWV